MFDSLLTIQGGAFKTPTSLNHLLERRLNVVFGRNGSGKSTIARAFRERQADKAGQPMLYDLSVAAGRVPDQEDWDRVFVFNEDFTEENIRVPDGLRSIKIGSSAIMDEPIQKVKGDIEKQNLLKKAQEDILELLDGTERTPGSIAEAEKQMKDGLKSNGGYLDRLKRLGDAQKLVEGILRPVREFDKDDKLTESISELGRILEDEINKYLSSGSGTLITWLQPDLTQILDIERVNDLLSRTIKPTSLNDEEKSILEELSKTSRDFLSQTESVVLHGGYKYCPLCQQPVTAEYRHTLERRLTNFREQVSREFQDEIMACVSSITPLDVQLPSFLEANYGKDAANVSLSVSALNDYLEKVKSALQSKVENPYASLTSLDKGDFDKLVSNCKAALAQIDSDINAYNAAILARQSLKRKIDAMNVRLAYHENKSWIDAYNERTSKRSDAEVALRDIRDKIEKDRYELSSLRARVEGVDEAREQIDKYLSLIFGGNRFRLSPRGRDKYALQILNGDVFEDLPPQSISSGERNALALSYFFACVIEHKDSNYNYSDPTLLIIDDPISSFDSDNKAGVLSLLSSQIKKVLEGNEESKVLVFTHDLTTLRELCDLRSRSFSQDEGDADYFIRIQDDHHLRISKTQYIRDNMEYYMDLQRIFDFAKSQDVDNEDGYIYGNLIRRFAESYASNIYSCKWHDLFNDDSRLKSLPEEKRERIRSFIMRSVLNSESHGVFSSYDQREVQRAARLLLIYMYYTSFDHLSAFLVGRNYNNKSKITTIERWATELI